MLTWYPLEISVVVGDFYPMHVSIQRLIGGSPSAYVSQVKTLPGQFNCPLVADKICGFYYRLQ